MANYVLTQTGQEVQDILDSMGATYFFSQTVSSWESDSTYSDYPYKGTITLEGVDGTMGVEVTFSNDQAISGNYSPICNTTNDAVEIWSKVNTSITIPTIKIYKNGYVNLNGSSNYMPQSGGNFTGAITVEGSAVPTGSVVSDFLVRRLETTITREASRSVAITAPTVSGYTFVSWLTVATNGWVGSMYVASPTSASTAAWVVATTSTGGGTGDVWCYALYKKKT